MSLIGLLVAIMAAVIALDTDNKAVFDALAAASITDSVPNHVTASRQRYFVSEFDYPLGLPFSKNGVQMRIGEHHRLYNSYAYSQPIFNVETLHGWFQKLLTGSAVKVVFSGDDATLGIETDRAFVPATAFALHCAADGIRSVTTVNRGVAAASTVNWTTAFVSSDIAEAADLYVLRWGTWDRAQFATDAEAIASFASALRAGLAQIRAAMPISSGVGIVLMTPLPAVAWSDPSWQIYGTYFEGLRNAVVHAALDYQCCFVDAYGMFQNARDSPTTNGWYGNYQGGNGHVAPYDTVNALLESKLYDVAIPSYIRAVMRSTIRSHVLQASTYSVPATATFFVSGASTTAEVSAAHPNVNAYPFNNCSIVASGGYIVVPAHCRATWRESAAMDNGRTGCMSFVFRAPYSGAPSVGFHFFTIWTSSPDRLGVADRTSNNSIHINHFPTSGAIHVLFYGATGTLITDASLGIWLPVNGTEYAFELDWDLVAGASRLFIDGVQLGSTIISTGTRVAGSQLTLGHWETIYSAEFRNLALFPTVQHVANFVPESAFPIKSTAITQTTVTAPEVVATTVTAADVVLPEIAESANFTGAWNESGHAITLHWQATGNFVQCCIDYAEYECEGGVLVAAADSVPAGYRPSSTCELAVVVVDESLPQPGRLVVDATGACEMHSSRTVAHPNTDEFSGNGNCGIKQQCVTWHK